MPWNFLQLVEIGAASNDLYPIATGRDLGIRLTATDTNPIVVDIVGVKVTRREGNGPWTPSLNVLRTAGKLVITDDRLAVTFGKFVPKDRTSFDAVLTARDGDGPAGRPRRKLALVGHIGMVQMGEIGARRTNLGADPVKAARVARKRNDVGLGSLIVSVVDGTDPLTHHVVGGDAVASGVTVEIIVSPNFDEVALAGDVMSRSVLAKVRSSRLLVDELVRRQWADLIRGGISPSAGDMDLRNLAPALPILAAPSPGSAPQHLTPPTDTSPVPTMFPTPAIPMPTLARPAPEMSHSSLAPTMSNGQPEPPRAVESSPPELPTPLSPAPPPPGTDPSWKTDPYGRFELRYWDGFGWTEHVSNPGEQLTDPP